MDSGGESNSVEIKEEDGAVVPKTETNSTVDQMHTTTTTTAIMSRSYIEPPDFISERKSYAEYKAD